LKIRRLISVFTILFLAVPSAFPQAALSGVVTPQASAVPPVTYLPRDSEKLISRARQFWGSLVSGKKTAAVELVLPAKRDAFLASSSQVPLRATVVGVDLTADPTKANVRLQVSVLMAGAFGADGPSTLVINDPWVLKSGVWYADVGNPEDLVKVGAAAPGQVNVKLIEDEIDRSLKFEQTHLEVGRIVEGQIATFKIPLTYTAKFPLSVKPMVPSEFVQPIPSGDLTHDTRELSVSVNGAAHEAGDFTFPVIVAFQFEAAQVTRTLVVTGSVFRPFSFRLSPSSGPITSRQPISIFVRNNTSEIVRLQYAYAPEFEILNETDVLPANAETEFRLQLKASNEPNSFSLMLEKPIGGLGEFRYRFRNGP